MQAIIYNPVPSAKRIKVYVPYRAFQWRIEIKQLNTSYYHYNQKLWSVVNTDENVKSLKSIFGKNGYAIQEPLTKKSKMPLVELNECQKNIISEFEKRLILKSYSANTLKNYRQCMIRFLTFFSERDYPQITKGEIEDFIYHLIQKYKISDSKQNSMINAIKFYYEKVLNKPKEYYEIQRPKTSKSLPNTLSEKEIAALLMNINNIKHRAILTLIYSAGLRVSEVINLRIEDILSPEMKIFIKGAKGKKDRYTILSDHALHLLRQYYSHEKPAYWLFEGQEGGKYSASSIQKIFRNAVKKARINPWATPHTLRHSFATHLLQSGVNLRYIQSLLGHESSKTTEIYTHVMSVNNKIVKSPLDKLMEGLKLGAKH